MKIAILHGFTSSGVVDPTNAEERFGFLGGAEMQAKLADFDAIVGVWPPDDVAIVIKAPEGIEFNVVTFPHARKPELHGSVTAEQFTEQIDARIRERLP